MIISERLKAIRTAKNLSQGEIEARTGLLRCYISRVENGHTVPSVETLEKIARGLDVPMYQLFYEGDGSPKIPAAITHSQIIEKGDWASRGKGLRLFTHIREAVSRMTDRDRELILSLTSKLNGRRKRARN
jgi:transcriptional regulator with XRE-family HTH domain